MTGGEAALAQALASQDRRRLRLEDVRALWRHADPIAAAAEDAHARFRQALAVLEASGVIVLPASPSAWDRSVAPPLPRSITMAAPAAAVVRPARPVTAWVPELGFAAGERHPAVLESLHALNAWFKRNRDRTLPVVPVTERSLEIFGDEKRLDALRQGETLFGGRLGLADLACRRLPPLLVWHPGHSGCPVALVVENAAAFDSFRWFNERAGLWCAVVWGAGNAFRHSHAGLDAVFAATGGERAVYFGDLDPKGVEILAAVVRERPDDLAPHRGLYNALAAARVVRREPTAVHAAASRFAELKNLLPEVAEAVAVLWRDGLVLPQEGCGTQALVDNPAPALRP